MATAKEKNFVIVPLRGTFWFSRNLGGKCTDLIVSCVRAREWLCRV